MSRTLLAFILALSLSSPAWAQEDPVARALTDLSALAETVAEVKNPLLRDRLQLDLARLGADLNEVVITRDSTVAETEALLRAVAAEPLDAGKLDAITRISSGSRITVEVARGLAALCTFDSTRKSALIALYPAVINPDDFQEALDVLTFDASREEVRAALRL